MTSQSYMHFKRPLTSREQAIMKENLGYIIKIDDWWMAEGQYSADEYWRVFEVCDQITAKRIDLNENERKEIIHDLIHIKFPHLTSINLSMNNIESIEDIQFLEAPSLSYLALSSNNISNFKSLTKCYFPNLKGLYVHADQNKFVSLNWLHLLSTSDSLDFLCLQSEENDVPIMEQNMALLFKIEAKQLKKVDWSCGTSIKNQKQVAMLGKKYTQIVFDNKKIS